MWPNETFYHLRFRLSSLGCRPKSLLSVRGDYRGLFCSLSTLIPLLVLTGRHFHFPFCLSPSPSLHLRRAPRCPAVGTLPSHPRPSWDRQNNPTTRAILCFPAALLALVRVRSCLVAAVLASGPFPHRAEVFTGPEPTTRRPWEASPPRGGPVPARPAPSATRPAPEASKDPPLAVSTRLQEGN